MVASGSYQGVLCVIANVRRFPVATSGEFMLDGDRISYPPVCRWEMGEEQIDGEDEEKAGEEATR